MTSNKNKKIYGDTLNKMIDDLPSNKTNKDIKEIWKKQKQVVSWDDSPPNPRPSIPLIGQIGTFLPKEEMEKLNKIL